MADDATAGASAAELEATIAAQQAELEELRARLRGPATSRRTLLKGAGVVAGGLAALTAVNSSSGGVGRPEVAGAIEGHNVKYGDAGRFFMKATSQNLGKFPGTTNASGHVDEMECTYFQQKVTSPRDAASGQSTGRRQYDAIVIRKRIDRNTPLFSQALAQNVRFNEVVFTFYDIDFKIGAEVAGFRVTLTNAFLAAHNIFSPETGEAGTTGSTAQMAREEMAFTFETISWEHVTGNTFAEDSFSDSI